jgi:hypothetical protein
MKKTLCWKCDDLGEYMNIEIKFKPGDKIKYYSSRYGVTTMKIIKIKVYWDKNELTIKYGGCPVYTEKIKRYYTILTWISNIKNIELMEG